MLWIKYNLTSRKIYFEFFFSIFKISKVWADEVFAWERVFWMGDIGLWGTWRTQKLQVPPPWSWKKMAPHVLYARSLPGVPGRVAWQVRFAQQSCRRRQAGSIQVQQAPGWRQVVQIVSRGRARAICICPSESNPTPYLRIHSCVTASLHCPPPPPPPHSPQKIK